MVSTPARGPVKPSNLPDGTVTRETAKHLQIMAGRPCLKPNSELALLKVGYPL
ncbi:unnamed protein product [Gulo gulo]|uniref:Uncharacterized protein n=1 Tax=Gulo gulo TaxID=48420 RepID=A0A9X9Q338_GULGU|nr:unnamed protein product [Gulo gulo]